MAKKPPVRVALDLETTGLHVEQDTILEVAAIKFQGNEVIDTFESFVAPGRSIPYRVQRLTSITASLLTNAPPFETISPTLQHFLGDLPIVGHSIPFDAGFLRKRGLARTKPLIDTFDLASVLLPSHTSYNLVHVADALVIAIPVGRPRELLQLVEAQRVRRCERAHDLVELPVQEGRVGEADPLVVVARRGAAHGDPVAVLLERAAGEVQDRDQGTAAGAGRQRDAPDGVAPTPDDHAPPGTVRDLRSQGTADFVDRSLLRGGHGFVARNPLFGMSKSLGCRIVCTFLFRHGVSP